MFVAALRADWRPLGARCDRDAPVSELSAQIIERTPLLYADAAPREQDRPAFVRAASGLVWFEGQLFIIQDDNEFIGIWTPSTDGALARGRVVSWSLGPRAGGRSRFEEQLGNRLDKSDYEACAIVPTPEGARLLVLGSGSLPRRELALLLDPSRRSAAAPTHVPVLFDAFRGALGLPAGVSNVEGVNIRDDLIWLYQRGPEPAAVGFDLEAVLRVLQEGSTSLEHHVVRRIDLGEIDGCPFGLSDLTTWTRDRALVLAVAENTSNPVDDGEILGTLVGVMSGEGVSSARLLDEQGAPARVKAEGIAVDPRDPQHALIVLDADDPTVPAELCRVRLSGFD